MRFGSVLALVVLVSAAVSAQAQEPASRAEWLRQQRAEKARHLQPYKASGLERGVLKLENDYLPRLVTPKTGFYPRLGSITRGGGFSVGPGYRFHNLFDGRADLFTSAAISWKQYWEVQTLFTMPRLARGRAFADVRARYTSFPEEDFFGLGPDSTRVDRVSYGLQQATVGVDGGWRPTPWMRVGGTFEFFDPNMSRGKDDRFPDVTDTFTEATAPGIASQPPFVRVGAFAGVDYAKPFNARRGGRYLVALQRFVDTDGGAYTFNRLDFDLQQYVPAFNERRVFVLRTAGSFADPAGDATVPFYLMMPLGGSHSLRGVRQFRFRDRSMLLLQAEYRFEILTAMDGAVFYDAGQVAPNRSALSLRDFERDYGVGLRIGTDLGVFIRFDVAFGSSEGTKTWLRFSHVF
jgi:hypothetical protein